LFLTYSPSFVAKNPGSWEITRSDFRRIDGLRDELVDVQGTQYDVCPPPSATKWLSEATSLSVDLETIGGLDPTKGDIQCIGATDRVGFGASFDPSDERIPGMLAVDEIVGQNFVLYDWWWLHNKGFHIPRTTRVVDTRYLGKLLNPDTPNDLTYLSGAFAKPPIRGYWKTKQNYRDRINDVVCIDVDATLRVKFGQMEEVEARGQTGLVDNYIVPLSRVVFEVRAGGMKIDKEQMDATREIILGELESARQGLPWLSSDGSPGREGQHAKVGLALYDELGLPEQRKRDTHKRTANGEALEKLRSLLEQNHASVKHVSAEDHTRALKLIESIETCRDLSKLEGNFLRYKVNNDNYVHPALNMGGSVKGKHGSGRGTATWRFSCSDPNAQQVPVRARNIFIPDHPDWEIASIDLKQAEVVGFLWYAEAWEVLGRVLREGLDAHRELAGFIVGRDATDAERKEYKNTTFALLYGEHEYTTAARLNRPVEEIRAVREHYFQMLPGAAAYRKEMISKCMNDGFVESPFGFRRILYLDKETGRAANQACNMPIQNIPPVVIGRAMIGMHSELPAPARIWMQVHDEVCLTYPKEMRKEVLECAIQWLRQPVPELNAAPIKMASGIQFNLKVKVGPNWRDLTSINQELGL
jgi:DNA polymerase I-like protein with 3'-5' exonuclease and polymerase domains